MSERVAPALILLEEMRDTARGPRREGLFALWLLIRTAEDALTARFSDRGARGRVAALEARLSTLTIPTPLRRGVQAALATLAEGSTEAAALALANLAAPARETVGGRAAQALVDAARRVAPDPRVSYRSPD